MNINILLGIISFTVWSIFGTWYYVTQIKGLPKTENSVLTASPNTSTVPVDTSTIEAEKVSPEAILDSIKPEPITVTKTIYFLKNTTNVVDESELNSFIDSLNSISSSEEYQLVAVGYTCDLGKAEYNQKLSEERATYIAKELRTSSINIKKVDIQGMGEQAPDVPNDSEPSRQKNRRVELTINPAP